MPTLNWIGKEAVVEHHTQVPFQWLEGLLVADLHRQILPRFRLPAARRALPCCRVQGRTRLEQRRLEGEAQTWRVVGKAQPRHLPLCHAQRQGFRRNEVEIRRPVKEETNSQEQLVRFQSMKGCKLRPAKPDSQVAW